MRFQLAPPSSLREIETGEPPASIHFGSASSCRNDQTCTPRSGKSARRKFWPRSVLRCKDEIGIARVHEDGKCFDLAQRMFPVATVCGAAKSPAHTKDGTM